MPAECPVQLTTDGLQAMPLNTGWVPVKACRLQDWGKLKKYVPSHKQGDVCNPPPPNWRPNLTDFADLFCRFVGFLNFADLLWRFVGFL